MANPYYERTYEFAERTLARGTEVKAEFSAIESAFDAMNIDLTDYSAELVDFVKRFLGSSASEPTTDGDGNPLQVGAIFYNSTRKELGVYYDAAWHYGNVTSGLLAAIDELTPSADKIAYFTSETGVALTDFSASARSFLATPSSANLATLVNDETGSGALVFATSPTLVTPLLGTPTSGTLTNCTGLPIASGVSGLGTGVATFLATPSSANLRTALTDETGTGSAVFATSPTLVTPAIGAATGSGLTLDAISTTLAGTAVAVFVYDTARMDSDGGQWIKRFSSGSLGSFPPIMLLVATSTTLAIYNGCDSSLTQVASFTVGANNPVFAAPTCIFALNGAIYFGTASGLGTLNLIKDSAEKHDTTKIYTYNGVLNSTSGGWV